MTNPYGHAHPYGRPYPWGAPPPPQPPQPPRPPWYRRWTGALVFGGIVVLGASIGTAARDADPDVAAPAATTRAAAPTTAPCVGCVVMPNVIGMAVPDAKAALDAAGWFGEDTGFAAVAEGSVVSGQSPAPGALVGPDSTVDLTTYVPVVPAPAAPAGPATTASDGVYEVGVDVEPGRYKTTGADPDDVFPSCYWARTRNDSGEPSAIIANNFFEGPGSVSIKSGEFVEFSGGCTWIKQ